MKYNKPVNDFLGDMEDNWEPKPVKGAPILNKPTPEQEKEREDNINKLSTALLADVKPYQLIANWAIFTGKIWKRKEVIQYLGGGKELEDLNDFELASYIIKQMRDNENKN